MPKIVVIDDDDLFRNYLVNALSDLDYVVLSAENGIEGLELCKTESPDLVITDIIMPEVEGVEVILKLHGINPKLPIIAMSGGNMGNSESYLNMAAKLGASAVLSKPFERAELIKQIENLLTSN